MIYVYPDELIEFVMDRHGYDQQELAKVLQTSQPNVSRWLRRETFPRIGIVDKLVYLIDN